MRFLLLFLATTSVLLAALSETVHSSVSGYYENRAYTNSLQKIDAQVFGLGADLHYAGSEYKVTYEHGGATTKKPPLQEDLKNQKLFLRYGYHFENSVSFNVNYINIIEDNIAITDGGKAYGIGISYQFLKQFSANYTQYFSDYKDFDTYQSDVRIDYKIKFSQVMLKLSSISKYIYLKSQNVNSFTKNAQRSYFTSGLKLHGHYKSYHLGMGAYIGKRAFAIMNDGFKIQHHAMEFDRTYALGVGKSISSFIVRFQYIYQRATELPREHADVEVKNFRLVANYKF